jgi:hypothetical protein
MVNPTVEEALENAGRCPGLPVAVEAVWDARWRVRLGVIYSDPSAGEHGYRKHEIGQFGEPSFGSINGRVRSWPEAQAAVGIGTETAASLGIPFYFPSPSYPEEECPRWWEQHLGYPCRACGILLLQPPTCEHHGTCRLCNIDERMRIKEAGLTPEERLMPHCRVCGERTLEVHKGLSRCAECQEKYADWQCPRCGGRGRYARDHVPLVNCWRCDGMDTIDSLSEEEREHFGKLSRERPIRAVIDLRNLLGIGIGEAKGLVNLLCESSADPSD